MFPQQALLARPLPKSKIYQFAKPSAAVKELFVRQIDSIVWQYKLAPETINLPATASVEEIQIFDIALKGAECDLNVLRCIDTAIPFKLFYRVFKSDSVRFTAAYKQVANDKTVIEGYFSSDWLPADTSCQALPIALNLQSLYEQMMQSLLPSSPRQHEGLPEQIARLNQLQQQQTECKKLEARLAKEKQFNRKVELNNQLRALKQSIEQIRG
ncbi:MAG: DUF4391 domain-containing protein [Methylococcales bacterium]|nr:DUF4391 domain-containing protein [Methylococcales bacterium]MDP3838503.1 DUF4391 domain-containing protein [Methylococcales bacterium]